jgi:hypothetical protein
MLSTTNAPRPCPHCGELIYPLRIEEQPDPIYPGCGCTGPPTGDGEDSA